MPAELSGPGPDLQAAFVSGEPGISLFHYGIMYSSNMVMTSVFQSLPLHRGSGFVELCFLAKGTETNLFGMDQHSP